MVTKDFRFRILDFRIQIGIFVLIVLLAPWFWQIPKLWTETKWRVDPVWKVDQFEVADINRFRSMHDESLVGKVTAKVHYNKISFMAEQTIVRTLPYWDLGFYFTANHPRERAGLVETEKLRWWLLPVFLFGLYKLVKKSWELKYLGAVAVYVLLVSVLGLQNDLSMMPVGLSIVWVMSLCFV